jgi:hypothetical protein
MGFMARSVARIPATGYEWYVTVLEDAWRDSISEELRTNFEPFVAKTGPSVLVVRGLNPEPFSYEVLRAYGLAAEPTMPALLISDASPSEVEKRRVQGANVKTIVIPLRTRKSAGGTVQSVLAEVVKALQDKEALDALQGLDRSQVEKKWGWLRMLELKPNFMGLGLNVNQALEDFVFRSK